MWYCSPQEKVQTSSAKVCASDQGTIWKLTSSLVLDKLERKFGGERFNNPDNDAKNAAMNQKMSQRVMKILPMVM